MSSLDRHSTLSLRRRLSAVPLSVAFALSAATIGAGPAVAVTATPPQVTIAANVVHVGQPSLDHIVLVVDKVIDPTSIPAPTDFLIHFGPDAAAPSGVAFLYGGFAGPNSAFGEPGIAFIRLTFAPRPMSEIAALGEGEFSVDYVPGAQPIRDRALNEAPGASVPVHILEATGHELIAGTIDHEYGADKLLLFTSQPLDLGSIPAADDFAVTIGSAAYGPASVAPVLTNLGVGVLELTLSGAVPAGTEGLAHVVYTPGQNRIVGRFDGAEVPAFDVEWVYVFLPTNDVTTSLGGAAGTVSTAGVGVSESDPVATTVYSPTGGTVSISEQELAGEPTGGYSFFGQLIEINAPPATDAADPIVLTFDLHATLVPDGQTAQTIQMVRNGVIVPECAPTISVTPVADPSPCVWERTDHLNGDVSITVATLQASRWNFGVRLPMAFDGFYEPVGTEVRNGTKAGSAIPLKFRLGGDRGLDVFAGGSPSSRAVACDTGAPYDEVEQTVTAGGSALSYNPQTEMYTYVWKTDRAWSGCRGLTLTFVDGSSEEVIFQFRP